MNLLAFDTSTDALSIAVQHGARVWQHSGAGGAQASATLIPAIRDLRAQAGLSFDQLDAVVFGRGPGSFTGLRTACAVAQGLAFGARGGQGVPVLPLDTLLAARAQIRQELPRRLTTSHQQFLRGLVRAEPDWSLMQCAHAAELPALRWKLANLEAFRKRRPADFEAQANALDSGLGQA